ncbi:MAG: leucine-rich repeat domain-containing protein [Bacteroidales bacterium]|nr:leucine-rich repeat domain-containing protein [Bacteroidales bacterium]
MKSISRNIAIICLLFTSLVGNAQMPEGFYDFMDTTAPGRIMYYDVVSDTVPYTAQLCGGIDSTGHLVVPDTVVYDSTVYKVIGIANAAFYQENMLYSVTLPKGITSIGRLAFGSCPNLSAVYWNATNVSSYPSGNYHPFYNSMALRTVVFADSVLIPDHAFEGTSITSVDIPGTISRIGNYAFANASSLGAVTLPEGIEHIGHHAFENTGLSSLAIPGSVVVIDSCAFYQCGKLTTATIANAACSIGEAAFMGCSSLKTIGLGDSVTAIAKSAFALCSALEDITIPNTVTNIGNFAFTHCDTLASVSFGNSLISIGDYAFSNCRNLAHVLIPNTTVAIGNWAFGYCSLLDSAVVGISVETIGDGAFAECEMLGSVVLQGHSLKHIGEHTFANCGSISEISLPASVQTIGSWAFMGCSGIEHITCKAQTPPAIDSTTWAWTSSVRVPLYIPCGSLAAYTTADFWAYFANIEERPMEYVLTLLANYSSYGKVVYNCTTSQIEAIPAEYRYFVRWADGNLDNPRTINISSDTSFTAIFEIGVGIEKPSDVDLTFYPNPTSGIITFSRTDLKRVEVMDIMGRTVAVFEHKYIIDLSGIKAGTYILRVTTAEGTAVMKCMLNN